MGRESLMGGEGGHWWEWRRVTDGRGGESLMGREGSH